MRELSVPAEVTVADGDRLTDMVVDNAREVPELVSFSPAAAGRELAGRDRGEFAPRSAPSPAA